MTHHVGMKAMSTVVPMAGHVGPMSGLIRELVRIENAPGRSDLSLISLAERARPPIWLNDWQQPELR